MVVFLWQRQAKYIIAFASCTVYSHRFGVPQTTPYLTPAHDAPQWLLSLSAPLAPSGGCWHGPWVAVQPCSPCPQPCHVPSSKAAGLKAEQTPSGDGAISLPQSLGLSRTTKKAVPWGEQGPQPRCWCLHGGGGAGGGVPWRSCPLQAGTPTAAVPAGSGHLGSQRSLHPLLTGTALRWAAGPCPRPSFSLDICFAQVSAIF